MAFRACAFSGLFFGEENFFAAFPPDADENVFRCAKSDLVTELGSVGLVKDKFMLSPVD